MHRLVQRDREQQAVPFHCRYIRNGHSRIIVIRNRSCRRVTVRDQRVAGVQLNRERLARFQHRVIKRADRELLCLATRPRKVQRHGAVVIILWSDQWHRPAAGSHVRETDIHIERDLHRMVQRNRKQQAAAFHGRYVRDRYFGVIVVRDRSNCDVRVEDDVAVSGESDNEGFTAFQEVVVQRVDSELTRLARCSRKA